MIKDIEPGKATIWHHLPLVGLIIILILVVALNSCSRSRGFNQTVVVADPISSGYEAHGYWVDDYTGFYALNVNLYGNIAEVTLDDGSNMFYMGTWDGYTLRFGGFVLDYNPFTDALVGNGFYFVRW